MSKRPSCHRNHLRSLREIPRHHGKGIGCVVMQVFSCEREGCQLAHGFAVVLVTALAVAEIEVTKVGSNDHRSPVRVFALRYRESKPEEEMWRGDLFWHNQIVITLVRCRDRRPRLSAKITCSQSHSSTAQMLRRKACKGRRGGRL